MSRTISYAAAIGMAVLGLILATAGHSPEASVLRPVEHLPAATTRAIERAPSGERGQTAGEGPAGPVAETSRILSLALDHVSRPRARPVEPPTRPQLRRFLAKGPLVARATDPDFRPRARPDDLLTLNPPPTLAGADELLCIAVAIYHEARNQPLDGQLAVASVILNRTRVPERWGDDPCEVVIPGQFSFLAKDGSYPPIDEPEAWAIAVEMAREALERGPSPVVGQADHYHTPAVQPIWDVGMEQVIQIDDHIFFVDPMTQG